MVRITREIQQHYRIDNDLHRALVGEFVASFTQIYLGLCINAQQTLSGNDDVTYSAIGWGLALLFAVLISNNLTGSDVNPAVSFCNWTLGNISFTYFVCYAISQIIGCFLAALFAFILYYEKINEYDGGVRQVYGEKRTAQIFTAYPPPELSVFTTIFNQATSSAVMALMNQMSVDRKNNIPKWLESVLQGAQATAVGLAFSLNFAPTVNPARDLGPRLFTLFAGYGMDVFSYNNWKWIPVPLLVPFIGCMSGTWIYRFLISFQISAPETLTKEDSCKTISTISSLA